MHWHRLLVRHACFLLTCLTAACAKSPTAPGAGTPVVSMVLIAGEPRHLAVITRAAPASGPIPAAPVPVAPSVVHLGVRDDADVLHPLESTSEPGRFQAQLDVLAGHEYRLEGTIDGEPVTAETTVPTRLDMTEPGGDTLRAPRPSAGPSFWEAPYRFETEGGAAFSMQLVQASASVAALGTVTARSGVWRLFLVPTLDYTAPLHLRVLALDPHAAAWLVSLIPQSTIHGALGGFGSALPLVRPLVVE